MRNRKILNILVILLCIFVIVSFVLTQTIATDYFKNMFWVASMFLMCGVLLDLNAWSKLGLDVDKTKSTFLFIEYYKFYNSSNIISESISAS